MNIGMHIINCVLQRMYEVQLSQSGLRVQTGTVKGPNREGHCIYLDY